MASTEERTARKDDYLVALYELSDGDTMKSPTHRAIAQRSGIPEGDILVWVTSSPTRVLRGGGRYRDSTEASELRALASGAPSKS